MRCKYLVFLLFCINVLLPGILYTQEERKGIQDIPLEKLLNTKISTAAKYGQKISEAPASVTIITSEDIERYGYRTLAETLNSIRGFYIRNDRNYEYLGVRGFSRPTDYDNRALILLNGHILNENVYGSAAIGTDLGLDMDIIERIEVVRGPGAALYGTGALFTVINIITKSGNMIDGLRLSTEAGSYGELQLSATFGKGFDNGIEVFLSGLWSDIKGQDLYFEEYDDSSSNNGIAENLDWDKYHGLLTTISKGDFSIQGMITSRKKGIPTGAWEMLFNGDNTKSLDERKFIELKYDSKISIDKNIMLRGYYDHYVYKGTYPYEDINWYDSNKGSWLGGEFQFRWDLQPNNRLIAGVEYRNHLRADYRSWDEDVTYFDENFPFHDFSLYLQDEYQVLENLSFTLGVRRDEYSTVGSSTTPRVAVIYNPIKSSTFKLLYGDAFRAPNVYEVHYEDPEVAKGNPDLRPEKIKTMEVIWEQRLSDELFGAISYYKYEMKDLINETIDPSDDLTQFQNLSKVKANGLELEIYARLKMDLWGYANYIFQNVEDANLNKKLTNSPSHIMKMGLSYPLMKHFYAAAEMQYETERITVYGTKTDPLLLTNIHLSVNQLFNHIKISLLIRNLFNIDYKLPGGFEHIQHSITQNGRNFTLKLAYQF